MAQRQPLLLLFGPTASGKTALAVALAKGLNAEVVNADSRQVYSRMPIMTAMPSADDFAAVPHHLFGFISPDQPYGVGQYLQDATRVIADIQSRGKLPLVVGGTGFYMKVLTEGISPIPDVPPEVSQLWQARWHEVGGVPLYDLLCQLDPPLAARLKPTDQQRITRGLAVQAHTGQPLSVWQALPPAGAVVAQTVKLGLNPAVEVLNPRIDARLAQMLSQGVMAEVAALKSAGYGLDAPGLSSIGCDLFYAHLDGLMTLDDVTQRFAQRQKQYAKRQRTWLRHQYKADIVLERGEISTGLEENLRQLLR